MRMIQLEMTERCNLRCGYCVYNSHYKDKRNYGHGDIKDEVALQSIKMLKDHSKYQKKVSISFYGGEPLLKYKTIDRCVNYSRDIFKKKYVDYSITTNSTLIDEDIASFLNKNRFIVQVSLDGPREMHDLWRKDIQKKGSFDRTVKGLKILCDKYKNELERVGLSMVYAPPYSEDKIEILANYLSDIDFMPANMRINISYPSPGSIPENFLKNNKITDVYDSSLSNWAKNKFFQDYKDCKDTHSLAKALVEKKIARIIQRPILNKPIRKSYLNGCCIPGARKLFVTTSGKFMICERIGKSPNIGNISSGINYKSIKEYYIDEYSEKSLRYCSNCWMIRLCDICYQHAFDEYKIKMEKKNTYCVLRRMGCEDD